MVLFEQAWSPGQTSPPYPYGGICSNSARPGAAALERKWRHLRTSEPGVVTVHMVGLTQMTPRTLSATFAPKEGLPHMPPYAHLVLFIQKVGFELIPHLPQRVPYAHMVAYAPAALDQRLGDRAEPRRVRFSDHSSGGTGPSAEPIHPPRQPDQIPRRNTPLPTRARPSMADLRMTTAFAPEAHGPVSPRCT